MHEIYDGTELIGGIKSKKRLRTVGHTQRDGIPFAERKSCGKIFRKHIDEPKDLPERIFFTVI